MIKPGIFRILAALASLAALVLSAGAGREWG